MNVQITFVGGPHDGRVKRQVGTIEISPVETQAKPVHDDEGRLLSVAYYKLESKNEQEWRYVYQRSERSPLG